MYQKAAELFQLDGQDLEFVANRVRHLDFTVRNSALADRVNWKSSTVDAWSQYPIYNQAYGVSFNFNSSGLKINGTVKSTEIDGPILNWVFSILGEANQITIRDGKNYQQEYTVPKGSATLIPLGDSGYSILLSNSLTSGQTAVGTVSVRWPYSGDLAQVKNRIISATDFVTQLIDGKSDLAKYFNEYAAPEDTVAACLIALDSI